MADSDRPVTAGLIDDFVQARIPDLKITMDLYKLVTVTMMYGLCAQARCLKKGQCTKKFPKAFCAETHRGENAYAQYVRKHPSEGGRTFNKKGVQFDDSWVVPYNPELLLRMGSHINIELIATCQVISYLFKYIFKGSDRSLVRMGPTEEIPGGPNPTDQDDEVQQWMDVRYISSHEACWRAFGFQRSEQSPSVQNLDFHLETDRRVSFKIEGGKRSIPIPGSTLLAFFELNVCDQRANVLLYTDVPKYFRIPKGKKKWVARIRGADDEAAPGLKRGNQIGLLPGVHNVARNRERFSAHVLLTKVRGPKSFVDLRTFDGVVYDNFTDAAFARGLLIDEKGADSIMRESGHLLLDDKRRLFVMLLIYWQIRNTGEFFIRHKESLLGNQARFQDREQLLLRALKTLLFYHGKTPSDFNIPEPERFTRPLDQAKTNFFVQHQYDDVNDRLAAIESLNADQRKAYDLVVDSLTNRKKRSLACIDAPGGTGKTYLLNTIAKSVATLGKKVVCTASSGVASLLLINGKTLYSAFNIPLAINESSVCKIDKNAKKAKLIRELDI